MFAQIPLHDRDQFIKLIQKCPGEAQDIVVKRDGQRKTIKVTPRLDTSANVGRIGAEIGTGKPVYRIEYIPPGSRSNRSWTAPSARSPRWRTQSRPASV